MEGARLAPFRRGGWPGEPLTRHRNTSSHLCLLLRVCLPLPGLFPSSLLPWEQGLGVYLAASFGDKSAGEIQLLLWARGGKQQLSPGQEPLGRPPKELPPAGRKTESAPANVSKPGTNVAKAAWLQFSWFGVGCDNGWWRTSVCSSYTLEAGTTQTKKPHGTRYLPTPPPPQIIYFLYQLKSETDSQPPCELLFPCLPDGPGSPPPPLPPAPPPPSNACWGSCLGRLH